MRKPVSEHTTTIKSRKGRGEVPAGGMEPVGGGKVRRVEFEEERRPVFREAETTQERPWHPRAHDSIDQIHFEVDNMHRLRRPAPRARRPRQPPETRSVFETSGGAVKESRLDTTEGERRVLYTSRRQGGREQDQRFHSGLVDRVIAQRYHSGPTWSEATEEKPRRGWLRKDEKPAPKQAKAPAKPAPDQAPSKPAAKAQTKPKAKAPAPEPAGWEPSDAEYQPQCAAVTQAGVQCRNSSKVGSSLCGSHQGYKPQRLADVLDTVPSRGGDTKPGVGDRAGTGQCAAYTKDGIQCRNGSRHNSKYCAVHKGYRPPSKAMLEKRLDTKPRHAGAKDTKPKLRR